MSADCFSEKKMKVEEDYQDVLQNLEGAIVSYYRENNDLIDLEVESALDWLLKNYGAEVQGKDSRQRPLKGASGEVAKRVEEICEWRLGRQEVKAQDEEGNLFNLEIKKVKTIVIVECLKRLKSSVKLWTQKGGRQGYLKFIEQFFKS